MNRGFNLTIASFLLVGAVVFFAMDLLPDPRNNVESRETETPPSDITHAKGALIAYFSLLREGNYERAIAYHGSGYETLRRWNPDSEPNDYAALFQKGCEENGWRCLRVRSVLEESKRSEALFQFRIQFSNEDGNLFEQGPCCGETEGPTRSEFDFMVEYRGGRYVVVTEPVYVP